MLLWYNNFIRFFKEFTLPDTMFKDTILNTFKTYLSSILIVYPVSVIMCYFIYKKMKDSKLSNEEIFKDINEAFEILHRDDPTDEDEDLPSSGK